jgi:glutaredoxin 3
MSNITMYSKKTCPFCVRVEHLLKAKGVSNLKKIEVDTNQDELQIMIARTGRRSVPQIFIGDTHVGGFDDLAALNAAGKLDTLLNN